MVNLNSKSAPTAVVEDIEDLYRALHPTHLHEGTISSAAFKCRPIRDVSVDRSSLCSAEDTLARHPKSTAVAQLSARAVRNLSLTVWADPQIDNAAHALIVFDANMSNKVWTEKARELSRICIRILPTEANFRPLEA